MVTLLPVLPGIALFLLATLAEPALARVELTRGDLASVADASSRRVDVLVPDLSDGQLIAKLKRLGKSGRSVRVIVSRREAGVDQDSCAPCKRLEAAGVDLRFVATDVLDSFVIADGPQTKAASGDLGLLGIKTGRTGAGTRLLRFVREGDYVLSYQQEFETIWSKAQEFGVRKRTPRRELRNAGGPFVLFSSTNMTPMQLPNGTWLFEPTLGASPLEANGLFGDYIAGAIDYAYDSVDVAVVGTLDRTEIVQALQRALTRGVRVRLLLESPVNQAVQALAARGATVVSLQGMNAKGGTPRLPGNALVIDRKAALTGNFRWTKAAEQKSFGSLVSLQGPVVTSYLVWMEYGFAKAATKMPRVLTSAAE